MCLALPVKIDEIRGESALVELSGVKREISLALVDNVQVGDYVIVHVGYALSKLDPAEAKATLDAMTQSGLTANLMNSGNAHEIH
ncbi:MAG: HypC/HybG/HupF family hydrogenase formation chaperone [Burkholderiales bacterium]|jgi:hydrogenase expression/formation protein HypC|nr:HypC/HybG/HupF family hydrogenase formation chaperone [Burkholderiales bacterium]